MNTIAAPLSSSSFPQIHSRRIAAHPLSRRPSHLPLRFPTISAAASTVKETTAPHPPTPISLYDVLGLSAQATIREIKSAYRSQVLKCHPDAAASVGRSFSSADEFLLLHEAYSTLSDPVKRAQYDRNNLSSRRIPPAQNRFSGAARRPTWETDQFW